MCVCVLPNVSDLCVAQKMMATESAAVNPEDFLQTSQRPNSVLFTTIQSHCELIDK